MICGTNYDDQILSPTQIPQSFGYGCSASVGFNFNGLNHHTNYFSYDHNWSPEVKFSQTENFAGEFGLLSALNKSPQPFTPPNVNPYYQMLQNFHSPESLRVPQFHSEINHQFVFPTKDDSKTVASSPGPNDLSLLGSPSSMSETLLPTPQPSPDSTSQQSISIFQRRNKGCNCINCVKGVRKIHKCEKCGKEYSKSSHLKAHIRTHFNLRPFACTFAECKKAFTRTDELQRHYRIHTGEKNYRCMKCEKRFGRSDHLSKHMKTHERKESKLLQDSRFGYTESKLKMEENGLHEDKNDLLKIAFENTILARED